MTGDTAGFSIHSAVFSVTEIAALTAEIEAHGVKYSKAGARHVLKCPPVSRLANHPTLVQLASTWLHSVAVPFKATLFDKNPGANWLVGWHQDTALPLAQRASREGWGPWSLKDGVIYAHAPSTALSQVIALRVHLDDSTPDNGPLRVLPGTHRLGVLTDSQVAEQARQHRAIACCAPAGAVVAMRPLLIHGSSKCEAPTPRRVLHIEYAVSLEIGDGLQLHAA